MKSNKKTIKTLIEFSDFLEENEFSSVGITISNNMFSLRAKHKNGIGYATHGKDLEEIVNNFIKLSKKNMP